MPNAVPQSGSSAHPPPLMPVPRPILMLLPLMLSPPCTRCSYIKHCAKLIMPRNTSMGIVRMASCSGLDRSGTTASERPLATHQFSFVISSRLSPLLSPSLLTRPPAQDKLRTNHFLSHSHSLPLSLFLLFVFLFFWYFRQRRSTLSCSSTAPVCSRTSSLIHFPFLLTFSLFFSLQLS